MPGEIAFGVIVVLTLGAALAAVLSRNLLRSALALMFCLLGVAGLFLMQGAEFLSAVQLLVYVGGIAVLIVFAVALLERAGEPLAASLNKLVPAAVAVGAALTMLLVVGLWRSVIAESPPASPGVKDIGTALLNQYLVPFEALSVLLLAALVGALLIARDTGKEG